MNYTGFLFFIAIFNFTKIFNPLAEIMLLPVLFYYLFRNKIRISVIKSEFLFLFVLFISIGVNILRHSSITDYFSTFHFPYLLFFSIIIIDKKFDIKKMISIIKIFTWMHVFLLISSLVSSGIFNLIFKIRGASNSFRLEGLFNEPAWMGIVVVFFILILHLDKKRNLFLIIINTLFCLFTFSGTAYVLLFTFSLSYVFIKLSFKRALKYGIFFSILFLLFVYFKLDLVRLLIIRRAKGLISGDYDFSTILRFIAPYQVIYHILKYYPVFGIGSGAIQNYIMNNPQYFSLLKIWTGERTTNVNNSYANIITTGGFSLFISYIIMVANYFKKYVNKETIFIFIFIIIFPFFSGKLAHPFFCFMFFFIKNYS